MNENPMSTSNPYAAPQADLSIQRAPEDTELASLGERLGAAVIDAIIMFVVVMVPIIIFYGGWSAWMEDASSESFAFSLVSTAFSYLMYVVVNGYLLAKNGQTVGKKIMDIKIVRTDGSPASFARIVAVRALFENALLLIPVVDIWLWLIDVLFIFRRSRKCLHDTVADTIVVRI
jgi:uncharacterized RDD family membrane protein YckC